jgi:hypothetical protein
MRKTAPMSLRESLSHGTSMLDREVPVLRGGGGDASCSLVGGLIIGGDGTSKVIRGMRAKLAVASDSDEAGLNCRREWRE